MSDRRSELTDQLTATRDRIERACTAVGRPNDVTLVAVTKTYPASDVRILAELGVRCFGENRDQEAKQKAADCADLDIEWHFIGQIQRNKVKSIARYADVIESIDRDSLVPLLAGGERPLSVLIQVSLDPPEVGDHRGGVRPDEVSHLARLIADAPNVTLRGVMGVAPLGSDPDPAFERLAKVSASLREEHPHATWISAGMSHDLEPAIAHGATHVRIGSALLGQRPPLR